MARRSGSAVTVFAKTGAGFGTSGSNPSADPSSRYFSLGDAVSFALAVSYTKGTSGEASINVGFNVSLDGGSTQRAWTDSYGARSIAAYAASVNATFALTSGADFFAGDRLYVVAWVSGGSSVSNTSLTVSLIPIYEA